MSLVRKKKTRREYILPTYIQLDTFFALFLFKIIFNLGQKNYYLKGKTHRFYRSMYKVYVSLLRAIRRT